MIRVYAGNGDIDASERVFAQDFAKYKAQPSASSYNAMIWACRQLRLIDKAFGYLDLMRDARHFVRESTYSELMELAISERQPLRAQQILTQMQQQRLKIHPLTVRQVLELALKHDEADVVLQAMSMLQSDGKILSIEVFTLVLETAVRTGREALGRAAWHSFSVQHSMKPPSYAFNAMIHLFAKVDKLGDAFDMMRDMEELGYREHGPTLQQVASAAGSSVEQLDRVYYILLDMRNQNKRVTLPMLNCVLLACANVEDVERAEATFAEVTSFGLLPDLWTYNALLRTYAVTGKVNKAFRLVEDMNTVGITPNSGTFLYLIHACLRDGNLTRGIGVLQEMKAFGVLVPYDAYEVLIRNCLRAGQQLKANALFDEMKAVGYKPLSQLILAMERTSRISHEAEVAADAKARETQ
eukprot:TRINITY_DN1811_c0_g1_i4.p1 TRINITY_DN1811_c0_g1~~TRINITY_DN1811_c0_g1_i4.p1  ORF type:complete len:412 (-),score=85.43 TRINITY_DN1811_c0_g1_i4:18-1253(-)